MIPIPESADTFKRFTVNSHKLASIAKIKTKFVEDDNFNLESYLENKFSRKFARIEENAFINGNGIDEHTGILNSTDGGEIGLTVEDAATRSYDHIIKLYFSPDKEHRRNAV